ncbi:hypothetical protein COOONC_15304 [Cooperia oncophora]
MHYIPQDPGVRHHVLNYLNYFDKVFPRLKETYVLAQSPHKETVVPFPVTCCKYDDPSRFLNHSAEYLLLHFRYGQNPRFFDKYLEDIHKLLQFSPSIRSEGNHLIGTLGIERNSSVCIHVRRTDFLTYNVATNGNQSVEAANKIAKRLVNQT